MSLKFRALDKEQLSGKVPCDLATVFRETAGRERKTISELMTECLCLGLRCDPKAFGIERTRRRRPESAAAS